VVEAAAGSGREVRAHHWQGRGRVWVKDLLLCNAEVVADGATLEGQGAGRSRRLEGRELKADNEWPGCDSAEQSMDISTADRSEHKLHLSLTDAANTLSSACGELVHCCFIIITPSRCNSGLDASPVSAEHGHACPLQVRRDSALEKQMAARVSGLANTRPLQGSIQKLRDARQTTALYTCSLRALLEFVRPDPRDSRQIKPRSGAGDTHIQYSTFRF